MATNTKRRDNKDELLAQASRNGAEAGAKAAIQALKDAIEPRHLIAGVEQQIEGQKSKIGLLVLGAEEFMRAHDNRQVFPHVPELHGEEVRCPAYKCQLQEMERQAEREKAELERLNARLLEFKGE